MDSHPEPREPAPPRVRDDRAPAAVAVADLADGLEAVRLSDDALAGARIGRLGLIDCAIERCDLAGLTASESSLVRVSFAGSRLTGLAAGGALLRDVRFSECRMDLASLAGARLERVSFEGCDLREIDFHRARLHDVSFRRCDLSQAILEGMDCSRTRLEECTYTGLRGLDGLRGAVLAWPDAVGLAGQLAGALGIHVTGSGA
jgi:uncharacterized protein YjbI with pentapeptide repeats